MSVQAMTAVFEESEMKGTARLVLLALANRDGDLGICPSIDRLARDCRMSRRAVQEAIKRCVEAGELHVEPNAGPHGTHRYWLHIEQGGCRFCTRADSAHVQVSGGKLHPNPRNSTYTSTKEIAVRDTPTSAPSRAKAKNPLFDALAEVEAGSGGKLTLAAARRVGVALAEIREASPEVTPEEILRRAANWPTHFPGATLTASALARHWARLKAPGRAGGESVTEWALREAAAMDDAADT